MPLSVSKGGLHRLPCCPLESSLKVCGAVCGAVALWRCGISLLLCGASGCALHDNIIQAMVPIILTLIASACTLVYQCVHDVNAQHKK